MLAIQHNATWLKLTLSKLCRVAERPLVSAVAHILLAAVTASFVAWPNAHWCPPLRMFCLLP
jgi:hypothetical protein